jgi:hypothetical protein
MILKKSLLVPQAFASVIKASLGVFFFKKRPSLGSLLRFDAIYQEATSWIFFSIIVLTFLGPFRCFVTTFSVNNDH